MFIFRQTGLSLFSHEDTKT